MMVLRLLSPLPEFSNDYKEIEMKMQVDHTTGPAGRTALHLSSGQGWSQVASFKSTLEALVFG